MNLYTYTIPYDDGAAPNPFGGICTLAICKPVIRRTAEIGDWIAAFGSKNRKGIDGESLEGKLVYAMKVTQIETLEKYNEIALKHYPLKIPDINSKDLTKRLGDCLYYDFGSFGEPKQRKGVHDLNNLKTDLSGKNVLMSNHYYYFGMNAIPLLDELKCILHQTQGHKKQANDEYKKDFVDWIGSKRKGQHGWPGTSLSWSSESLCSGCSERRKESEADKEVGIHGGC